MTDETTAPTASRIDEQGRPEPPMAADETGTLLVSCAGSSLKKSAE